MSPPPPPAAPRFAVSIGGQTVPAQSPVGGHVRAYANGDFPAASGPPQREITSFVYTRLQFKLGLEMGTPILNWVNAAMKGTPFKQSGTIIELDDQSRAKSYLDFTDGRLSDFVIPGFDSSNDSATAFTVDTTISKSVIRSGDMVSVPPLPANPKPFRASNFRLKIDGLLPTRVRTIDPLSFRLGAGGRFVPEDLVVTFPSLDVRPWREWVNDFIVNGNNGPDKEKQGTIEILGTDLAQVYATLTLKQIGILELAPTDDTTTRTHRARMYYDYAQLSIPA
jgi:hypothetical protein